MTWGTPARLFFHAHPSSPSEIPNSLHSFANRITYREWFQTPICLLKLKCLNFWQLFYCSSSSMFSKGAKFQLSRKSEVGTLLLILVSVCQSLIKLESRVGGNPDLIRGFDTEFASLLFVISRLGPQIDVYVFPSRP